MTTGDFGVGVDVRQIRRSSEHGSYSGLGLAISSGHLCVGHIEDAQVADERVHLQKQRQRLANAYKI